LPEIRPLGKVLVTDRGAGATRVLRALRDGGVASVALHDSGPRGADVRLADEVVISATTGDVADAAARVVLAAESSGACAVHPGYSPLGRDPRFVSAIERAGLVFVGPSSGALQRLHDPHQLREAADSAGITVLPAKAPDGPIRHITVTVLADGRGRVVHLHDRDCIVRGDGRVLIDTAPSRAPQRARDRATSGALLLAARLGLRGPSTIELIVNGRSSRLWLRGLHVGLHPVDLLAEAVTGVDLVAEQLRLAEGHPMRLSQSDVNVRGVALQCRVLAVDLARGLAADEGVVRSLELPQGPSVRAEARVLAGAAVDPENPTVAHVLACGSDLPSAVRRLSTALAETHVGGVRTNLPLLREVLLERRFHEGELCTRGADELVERLARAADTDTELAVAALLAAARTRRPLPCAAPTSGWASRARAIDMAGF
jgi:acetyl/propionyl-CoA carboxylase alpha subunit